MNTLLRWLRTGALTLGLVLGPPLAYAAYIMQPNSDGSHALTNTLNSVQVLWLGRANELEKLNSARAHIWELDRREYVIHIADIGTAASHHFVMPTTGVIERIDATFDYPVTTENEILTGADTVLRMYSSGIATLRPSIYAAGGVALYTLARVTEFTLTYTQNSRAGALFSDTQINQTVNQGDVIAIETDGGTTGTRVGRVSIWVRAAH